MQESPQQQQQAAQEAEEEAGHGFIIDRVSQNQKANHSFGHRPPSQSLSEYLVVVTALPSI